MPGYNVEQNRRDVLLDILRDLENLTQLYSEISETAANDEEARVAHVKASLLKEAMGKMRWALATKLRGA